MLAIVLAAAPLTSGCASEEEAPEQTDGMALSDMSSEEQVVRTYYAAAKTDNPAEILAPIVDDHAVLAAPSVRLLKRVDQVEGKHDFVESVAGASFLLKHARSREIIARGHLVVSRIDLPLPNGDEIAQVEYFEIKNGKIARLDSYYDALRFAASLPSIGIEWIKNYIEKLRK